MALYLSPTKALAADQFAAIRSLHLPTVRAATYDGDTDQSQRRWIRDHANFVLCNPDMLHFGVLPNHALVGPVFPPAASTSSSTKRTATGACSAPTWPT